MKLQKKLLPILLTAALLLTVLLLTGAAVPVKPKTAEECAAAARDAVVYVRSFGKYDNLKSTGSGFLISGDGTVITAAHVISDSERVTVILTDGEELEAKILYCDIQSDAAALRLPEKTEGEYTHIQLGKKAPVMGAKLRAMGYPQKGTAIITEGIVAAENTVISGKDRMMVTCQIVNGMSGGPILNEQGEAVGIVSGSVLTMSGIHLSVLPEELLNAAAAAGAVEFAAEPIPEEAQSESKASAAPIT